MKDANRAARYMWTTHRPRYLIGAFCSDLAACATLAALNMSCSDGPSALADAGTGACLSCGDAGVDPPWTNTNLPLGNRMANMLHDCSGAEACHLQGSGGLTIVFGNEFAQLIDVRSVERPELLRVAPGDPAQSYVYLKLAGDGGIDGSPMPASVSFDPRRPALAWAWIEAGAPTQ